MNRVFVFKACQAGCCEPPKAATFLMQYPCVIGRYGVTGSQGKQRFTWLEVRQFELAMRHDRPRATAIESPERLDQLLGCLATLVWTDGVFVEPKGEA